MRRLCALCLVLFLLCGAAFALDAEPAATAFSIKTLTGEYTVASDGACTVLLTAEMHFSAGVDEFSLPVPSDARNITFSIGNYTTVRRGDTLLLTVRGARLVDQTVVLSYTLPETATGVDDAQRCKLRLLLADRACPIDRYSATVTLPKEFETLPQFESGYYGDLIENYLDIQIHDGVISLRSRQSLRDHESLTMTLELPENYFDLRFLAGKTAKVDMLLFWAFLGLGAVCWLLLLRNRFLLPKSVAMPPPSGNAGAVPYELTGDRPDLPIMLMHWASLGYLTITRLRGRVLLEKQIDMGSERKGYETQIFRNLFSRSEAVEAPCDDYRICRENTPELAKGYWEIRLFAPHAGRPILLRALGALAGASLTLLSYDRLIPAQGWRWFVIVPLTLLGALACWLLQPVSACFLRRQPEKTLALAIPSLLYLFFSMNAAKLGLLPPLCILYQLLIGLILALGGKRTVDGMRQAEALLGLRRYLLFTKPEALQAVLSDDPQYFYRMLPYADALRVGGRFTKKFNGVPLEPCAWLQSERRQPETAAEFYSLYRAVLDTLREQTDAPLMNLIDNLRQRRKRASE